MLNTQINKKLAYDFDQPTGGTGFFECIDDQDAANTLFEVSKEWLKGEELCLNHIIHQNS